MHQRRQQLPQTTTIIQTVCTAVSRIYHPEPERSGDSAVNAVTGLTRNAPESAIKINISRATSVLTERNLSALHL